MVPLAVMGLIFDKCAIWQIGIPLYTLLTIGFALFAIMCRDKSQIFKRIVCYLGKYATNIYIIHLMLSKYWYSEIYLRVNSPWLLFLALLIFSLVLSILIRWIKEYSGYDKVVGMVINKIISKVTKYETIYSVSNLQGRKDA